MNPWPKLDPHENHKEFPFSDANNPVKDGKLKLGRGPVPVPQTTQTKGWHWAMFSNQLIGMIKTLNGFLLAYKTTPTTTPEQQGVKEEFKKEYKRVAKEIEDYIKNGGDAANQYVEKGSVAVDAIESGGFTIGIRLFGVAKGIEKDHHSSSSYYSFYSACQGS